MKKIFRALCLIFALTVCLCAISCNNLGDGEETVDETVVINMNTEYALDESLPRGDGQRVKVILLLG